MSSPTGEQTNRVSKRPLSQPRAGSVGSTSTKAFNSGAMDFAIVPKANKKRETGTLSMWSRHLLSGLVIGLLTFLTANEFDSSQVLSPLLDPKLIERKIMMTRHG